MLLDKFQHLLDHGIFSESRKASQFRGEVVAAEEVDILGWWYVSISTIRTLLYAGPTWFTAITALFSRATCFASLAGVSQGKVDQSLKREYTHSTYPLDPIPPTIGTAHGRSLLTNTRRAIIERCRSAERCGSAKRCRGILDGKSWLGRRRIRRVHARLVEHIT